MPWNTYSVKNKTMCIRRPQNWLIHHKSPTSLHIHSYAPLYGHVVVGMPIGVVVCIALCQSTLCKITHNRVEKACLLFQKSFSSMKRSQLGGVLRAAWHVYYVCWSIYFSLPIIPSYGSVAKVLTVSTFESEVRNSLCARAWTPWHGFPGPPVLCKKN